MTYVIITRHRQNIYLPVYGRRWRRVEIGVSLAGVVEVEEVGVARLATEVVTLVATDGAVVSALLELDFMPCCPPYLSNITRFFFLHRWGSCGGLLW